MKTYFTYRDNIQGFKNVAGTVKTVEKIAASSIHYLKQAVTNLHQYSAQLEAVLGRLSLFYQEEDNPLLQEKKAGRKTLVILTGDKGLVGGLWHLVINAFSEYSSQYHYIITVGIKAKHYLEEENIQIIKSFADISSISQKEGIDCITGYIFSEFKKGTLGRVDILYPQFISLAQQQPVFVPFLPFEFISNMRLGGGEKSTQEALGLPIFEPSKSKLFDQLLQKYIGVIFYKIMMETKLSELSARTVAMEHASVKTEELIHKFVLGYMKDRRQTVTQKQLESFIVHKKI